MKAFVKTESKEMVSINGYEREIDWARDAVNHAILSVAIQDTDIRKKKLTDMETVESRSAALKENYRNGINQILNDNHASDIIFAEDDSLELVAEVYEYLTNGYTEYRKRRAREYSPKRIADEPGN